MDIKGRNEKPVIGILLGDATGIGPELVAKVAAKGVLTADCFPVIIGDMRVLRMGVKTAGVDIKTYTIDNIDNADWSLGIPVLDQKDQNPDKITIGKASAYCGKAVGEMIITTINLYKLGKIDGFCYAPFNKEAIKLAGFKYESEHEFFADCFKFAGLSGEMNVSGKLWTSRTTSHIPVKEISNNLTVKSVMGAIKLANQTLKRSGIGEPRIGVAALNPHAGENGLCGDEEVNIIIPASEKCRQEGINVLGVFPADTIFIKAFKGEFDAVVTMYHDQGQIALKLNQFDHAVTVAAGLPAPMTTPAHGTAFDIVGKGIARTGAYEHALNMAISMARYDNMLKYK
ncbi:MAG TPA: 4-hydroxythreonine-4-phosphate dehydrogenase PdxA [Ruminiclostridium sp.]